jgi:hypothetical protein
VQCCGDRAKPAGRNIEMGEIIDAAVLSHSRAQHRDLLDVRIVAWAHKTKRHLHIIAHDGMCIEI